MVCAFLISLSLSSFSQFQSEYPLRYHHHGLESSRQHHQKATGALCRFRSANSLRCRFVRRLITNSWKSKCRHGEMGLNCDMHFPPPQERAPPRSSLIRLFPVADSGCLGTDTRTQITLPLTITSFLFRVDRGVALTSLPKWTDASQ